MDSPKKQASKILRDKKMYQRWLAIFMCLALVVTSGTVTALKLTGQAWTGTEQVYACTYTPHQHTEQCYDAEGKLVCGYSDLVLHTHDARCYDSEGSLICTMEELEEHSHTSECYTEVKTLICTEEEHEAIPAHKHSDECYTTETVEQKDLTCGLEEGANAVEAQPAVEGHHHTDACYTITPAVEATYDEEGNELTAAVPEQRTLTCGLEESEGQPAVEAVPGHVHTEECYTTQQVEKQVLTCGLEEHDEEIPAHHHSDECYAIEMVLTCDKPEVIAHEHTDACYDIQKDADGNEISRTLTCKLPQLVAHQHGDECFTEVALEAEGTYCGKEAHKHTGSCYMDVNGELVLTCGKEEHVHTDECFIAPAAEPVVQEYRGEDYTVTVSYDPAAFEGEVSLNVREIAEGTEEYEQCYQQSLEATGSESLSFARFFDVTFTDAEGNEVEPAQGYNVDVQIAYDQPIEIAENENGQAVHFVEDEEGNVVVETPETAVEENAFNFSQGSFSPVGTVVGSNSIESGNDYFIYVQSGTQYFALGFDKDGKAIAQEVSVSNNTVTFIKEVNNANEYLWRYTKEFLSSSKYLKNVAHDQYLVPSVDRLSSSRSAVSISDGHIYVRKYADNEGGIVGTYYYDYAYLKFDGSNFVLGSEKRASSFPSDAATVFFAKPMLPAGSVTIGTETQVVVGDTITLTATVKDTNGATINNPSNDAFTWEVANTDGEVVWTQNRRTCQIEGKQLGKVQITVKYDDPVGKEIVTSDPYTVTVIASKWIDDGLSYNQKGLYQEHWYTEQRVWYDGGLIRSNNFDGTEDHVQKVVMIPSDYQGNPLNGEPEYTITHGDGSEGKSYNASHYNPIITVDQLYPHAKKAEYKFDDYVPSTKADATYIKIRSAYYAKGTTEWNSNYNQYNDDSGVFYRRLVSSDYYAYAKMRITPEPGYYVTKVDVVCMWGGKADDCSRLSSGVSFSANFDLSNGMSPEIVIRSDAFSHASSDNNGQYDYMIIISTAAIPSPLYVKYDPGVVVINGQEKAANDYFKFDIQNGVWLQSNSGRTTVTGNNISHSATVDKIEKQQGSDEWKNGDLTYTIGAIQPYAEEAAKAMGYRFAGWKIEYYDDKDINLSGDKLETLNLKVPSSSTDPTLYQNNGVTTLATNAKIIAQWEPVPVAEITKTVVGLSDISDLLATKNYTFTIKEQTPGTDKDSKFVVKTQYHDATGWHDRLEEKTFVNGVANFTLPMQGNRTFNCSISGLDTGIYFVEETGTGNAITVLYNGKLYEGPDSGKMDVVVALNQNLQETAAVEIINNFAPPQGQMVRIVKQDESGKPLAGAKFTLAGVDADDNAITIPGVDSSAVITTNDAGTVFESQDAATMLPVGTYTLTETAAPEGYVKPANSTLTFEILPDGTVRIIDKGGFEVVGPTQKDSTVGGSTYDGYTIRVKNAVAAAKVQLFKHSSETGLPGAEFDLYVPDENGTVVAGIEGTVTKLNTGKIISGDNGRVDLPKELELGKTYYLVETKAPDGYNGLSQPVVLKYAKSGDAFSLSAALTNGDATATKTTLVDGVWIVAVSNNPGTEMPHTGGIGTHGFMVGGGLLMMLAAGLLLLNKRRRAAEQ